MMNIKVLRKKLVKPSTPTPPNLKTHELSFSDKLQPAIEVGAILFYSSKHHGRTFENLEESLARVLVQFYPLAGRFASEDQIIDCGDQGAELIEAEAPATTGLATLIEERNLENLLGFLPRQQQQVDDYPVLSVQITRLLDSGEVVIGIAISHKVFDMSSMATFLEAWSDAIRDPSPAAVGINPNPSFNSPLSFPGKNRFQNQASFGVDANLTVKRFSFDEKAIIGLRSSIIDPVSKVRAVSALIARVLIGVDRAKGGRFRSCCIMNAVNMRGRGATPIPKHTCGNLVVPSISVCHCSSVAGESEAEAEGRRTVRELANLIGESNRKAVAECGEVLSFSEDERKNVVMNPITTMGKLAVSGMNVAFFSDYTKFGFYEADFGWGKPVWVSIAPQPVAGMAVLMNNREGNGIEAWVNLDKKDMLLFEEDEEIQMFAT